MAPFMLVGINVVEQKPLLLLDGALHDRQSAKAEC